MSHRSFNLSDTREAVEALNATDPSARYGERQAERDAANVVAYLSAVPVASSDAMAEALDVSSRRILRALAHLGLAGPVEIVATGYRLREPHRHDFAEYQGAGIYACACGSTDNGTGGSR